VINIKRDNIYVITEWGCVMKSYDDLKTEMEAIRQQMVKSKRNERANALKEVKRLCKELGFKAGMLKGSLLHLKDC
jgi:hypothetical protein